MHLVGFYITLPTLMMYGQTQIKFFLSVFYQYYLYTLHVSDLSRSIIRRKNCIFCDTWHLCSNFWMGPSIAFSLSLVFWPHSHSNPFLPELFSVITTATSMVIALGPPSSTMCDQQMDYLLTTQRIVLIGQKCCGPGIKKQETY